MLWLSKKARNHFSQPLPRYDMANPILSGKYALVRKIASGGMAEVFLAKQLGLKGFEKLVVVKRILPHLAEKPAYVKMFLQEAQRAADLDHSNIVHTFEIDADSGIYYMVMEFLYGQDLRTIYRRLNKQKAKIPLIFAVGIINEACLALQYVHTKSDVTGKKLGIVHRDVSPHNLILTYEGETKLVDFGIAKSLDSDSDTQSGVLKGKYAYMSPEQISGDPVTAASDQFSLGIILHELISGKRLFKCSTQVQTLKAVSACNVIPPASLEPGCPQALSAVVERMLSKSPSDRFESCQHVRMELEKILKHKSQVFSPIELRSYIRNLFSDLLDRDRSEQVNRKDFLGVNTVYWSLAEDKDESIEETICEKKKPQKVLYKVKAAFLTTLLLVLCFVAYPYFFPLAQKSNPVLRHQPGAPIVRESSNVIEMVERLKDEAPFIHDPQQENIAPLSPGRLKVVVSPWADVYINKKHIGTTPFEPRQLEPGRYTVHLKNDRLNKVVEKNIHIQSGKDTLIRESWVF